MPRPREISDGEIDHIARLFNETDWTYEKIAQEVGVTTSQVHKYVYKLFDNETIKSRKKVSYRNSKLGELNPYFGKSGAEGAHWRGGQPVHDGKGYLIVPKPAWYTGRKGSKYVFQHTVVMCEALGLTELPAGFVVHHIDRNRQNNELSNLALVTTAGHTRLHALERVETIPRGSRGK